VGTEIEVTFHRVVDLIGRLTPLLDVNSGDVRLEDPLLPLVGREPSRRATRFSLSRWNPDASLGLRGYCAAVDVRMFAVAVIVER